MCHNCIKTCHRYPLQPLRLYSLISFFNLSTLLIWLLQFSMQGYNLLHELRKIMHSIWGYGLGIFHVVRVSLSNQPVQFCGSQGPSSLTQLKHYPADNFQQWLFSFHNLSYMKRRKPLQWLHVVPDKCNASEKWEIGLLLGQNSNAMINKLLLSLQPQVLRSDAHVFSSEYNFRWQYIKKLPPLNGRNEKTQSTANGENHLN